MYFCKNKIMKTLIILIFINIVAYIIYAILEKTINIFGKDKRYAKPKMRAGGVAMIIFFYCLS